MQNYFELTNALEYIENQIPGNCTQADIAKSACVSLSALQKMFRYVLGYSINEYILKRKMTMAVAELENSSVSISELALKYGYNSTEAFSRAFLQVNCVLPSDYRKGKKVQAVFTPVHINETGIGRDFTALTEAIHNAEDCYIVCFDVADTNKIPREARNLALMETINRIHTHMIQEMRIFRIGRNEFVTITSFSEISDVKHLVSKVLEHNGNTFSIKGDLFPLFIRSWYGKNVLKAETINIAETLRQKVKYQGVMKL